MLSDTVSVTTKAGQSFDRCLAILGGQGLVLCFMKVIGEVIKREKVRRNFGFPVREVSS